MEKAPLAIAAGLVVAGAATAVWALGGMDWLTDNSHGAVSACEEEIREGLVSPTSFKLIWSDYTPRPPITFEERREIVAANNRQCEPNCTTGEQITRDFTTYMDRMGPTLARRLKRGDKMSEQDRQNAELWISVQDGIAQRKAQLAKNLPQDQSAFVTLEYDAENSYGAALRQFAMCRFDSIGTDGRFARSEIIQSGPVDAAAGQQAKDLADRLSQQ